MNWDALRDLAGQGYSPRSMLDVGAHLGAFSKSFVDMFPSCAPVLIEPNPYCAEALSQSPFERHAFAASSENGEGELHLTKEWLQSTGASLYRENTHFFRDEVLMKVRVPKRRIDDVFAGRSFDFVKIDTQGAELDVLRGGRSVLAKADFLLIEVSLVDYNQNGAKAEDVFAELGRLGFDCAGVVEFHRLRGVADGGLLQMDFMFENRRRKATIRGGRPGGARDLLDLSAQLRTMGSEDLSVELLRRLSGLGEPDAGAIELLAQRDIENGDLPQALQHLLRLRDMDHRRPSLMRILQDAIGPAVAKINALLAVSDLRAAKSIAIPLAQLLPGYAPAQRTAMAICASLSEPSEAGEFALNILKLEPADKEALRISNLSDFLATARPAEAEPARQALLPPPGRHDLLILRYLHDAAAAILCGEVHDADISRLNVYMQSAQALEPQLPDDADLNGWLKHYRMAFKAMDPAGFLDPVQPQEPLAPTDFATVAGEALTKDGFLGRIRKLDPKAIFFVAADARYVGLYAQHYVDSVVRNCDVPYAVVVHVIGGQGRLGEISRSIGRDGVQMFLTGDAFDAAAISTKCYDTPPKCLIPHPAAHYQSVRFQKLGWMLRETGRPIFVSDIDLLLQRGISDLLERTAEFDLVLNENRSNMSAGSRLTANLLLLNPKPGAHFYAAALRSYLDRHLAGAEVSRWIDQFGLVMARHRLRRERPDAMIGYFDTNSDINNVMYRSFERNPFRFLSLYHGFDMNSLKSAA